MSRKRKGKSNFLSFNKSIARSGSKWWGGWLSASPSWLPLLTAHKRRSSVRPPHHTNWHESDRSDDGEDGIGLWWGGTWILPITLRHLGSPQFMSTFFSDYAFSNPISDKERSSFVLSKAQSWLATTKKSNHFFSSRKTLKFHTFLNQYRFFPVAVTGNQEKNGRKPHPHGRRVVGGFSSNGKEWWKRAPEPPLFYDGSWFNSLSPLLLWTILALTMVFIIDTDHGYVIQTMLQLYVSCYTP